MVYFFSTKLCVTHLSLLFWNWKGLEDSIAGMLIRDEVSGLWPKLYFFTTISQSREITRIIDKSSKHSWQI